MPLVPMVIQSDGRAERSFDIFSRLLDERIVFVGQAIDDEVANLVVAQLLHLEAADPDRDICLYVNSPGGVVYAGMAIYDTMRLIRPLERDRFFTPDEARDHGLVDTVTAGRARAA